MHRLQLNSLSVTFILKLIIVFLLCSQDSDLNKTSIIPFGWQIRKVCEFLASITNNFSALSTGFQVYGSEHFIGFISGLYNVFVLVMTYSYWDKDVGSRENVIGGTLNSMPHVKSSVLRLKQSVDKKLCSWNYVGSNIQIVIQTYQTCTFKNFNTFLVKIFEFCELW